MYIKREHVYQARFGLLTVKTTTPLLFTSSKERPTEENKKEKRKFCSLGILARQGEYKVPSAVQGPTAQCRCSGAVIFFTPTQSREVLQPADLKYEINGTVAEGYHRSGAKALRLRVFWLERIEREYHLRQERPSAYLQGKSAHLRTSIHFEPSQYALLVQSTSRKEKMDLSSRRGRLRAYSTRSKFLMEMRPV
jgi:hypothetical protein